MRCLILHPATIRVWVMPDVLTCGWPYIKFTLTINLYIITSELDELFYLFYISVLLFPFYISSVRCPPLYFIGGASSKSYNGFYIVLLAPGVLLRLQQSLCYWSVSSKSYNDFYIVLLAPGASSKSYNGFYIVLLAQRVLLRLQQSLFSWRAYCDTPVSR